MLKTEEIIRYVLGTSHNGDLDALVPVRQIHLWLHVNHQRRRDKRAPLDRRHQSAASERISDER